jgi:glucose dehydrogenase
MSVLLKCQNNKRGIRGIFAIILACISVIAASCGTGSDYSKDIGTVPGAQTQFCTPQTGLRGEQPSPTAVKPRFAPYEAMFGFDTQHTHFNPYEHTLNPTNVSRLVLDWTATTAKPLLSPGLSSPTVANGVVYAASNDGNLYALNATTGAVLWSTCVHTTLTTPAVVKGVVYIIGSGGKLYALNATTGVVLWTTFTDGYDSSPTVANGVIYIGSHGGKLYALNAITGAVLWSVTPNSGVDTGLFETPLNTPAVANGVVYVDLGGFKMFAYHLPG